MVKTLYLVRHAKSSWANGKTADFDRPLNTRGLRDAPEMGKRLKRRNARPDIVISSPAKRARQTVELLTVEICVKTDAAVLNERIYEASTETLLDIIHSLPTRFNSAMIVGHNPSMTWLVNQLADIRIESMPTCAIATLELPYIHWKSAGTCPGKLIDFDYPKKTGTRR